MIQLQPEQVAAIAAQMSVVSYLEQEVAKRKQEMATGLFLAFGIDMLRENWVFDPTGGVLYRVAADNPTTGPEPTASVSGDAGDATAGDSTSA